jgi:hypothetical protein
MCNSMSSFRLRNAPHLSSSNNHKWQQSSALHRAGARAKDAGLLGDGN